jgi:hypothetical protein
MKDHDSGIAVTEHSVHRGVRSKSLEAVRVLKPKPAPAQRHAGSMPDSRDPATPPSTAPSAVGSAFEPPTSPTLFREEPLLF